MHNNIVGVGVFTLAPFLYALQRTRTSRVSLLGADMGK